MFNSPINPLFGVTSAGQEGRQGQQGKENSEKEKDKKEHNSGNIFTGNDGLELYTDIIEEAFDEESYIINYFERLKDEYSEDKEKLDKINRFLSRFDKKRFERKYGKSLSKEDLNVILYEKVIELGL